MTITWHMWSILSAALVHYAAYHYIRYFIFSSAKFIITTGCLLARNGYYSYILTVSMLLLGKSLSFIRARTWEKVREEERYARCMQTYVLFQYSILRNIVSKTSESLIRHVVNLAFRFAYISHPVYTAMRYLRLHIAATSLTALLYSLFPSLFLSLSLLFSISPFQYSLNNISSINPKISSESRHCLSSNRKEKILLTLRFSIKLYLLIVKIRLRDINITIIHYKNNYTVIRIICNTSII